MVITMYYKLFKTSKVFFFFLASLLALGQVRASKCYSQKSADIRCGRTPMLFWLDTEKTKKQKSMCFQMEMNQFSNKKMYLQTQNLSFFTETPVWLSRS